MSCVTLLLKYSPAELAMSFAGVCAGLAGVVMAIGLAIDLLRSRHTRKGDRG